MCVVDEAGADVDVDAFEPAVNDPWMVDGQPDDPAAAGINSVDAVMQVVRRSQVRP
jgi:hypothetical protein